MSGKGYKYVVLLLLLLVGAQFFGFIDLSQLPEQVRKWWKGEEVSITPQPPQPTQPTREAAALQFSIHNAITDASITSANTKVDITRADKDGVIDFMKKVEQVTVNSDPEQSAQTYSEGDLIILHVSSDVDPTGGTDHYDGWYYVRLKVGEPVRKFSPDLLQVVQTSPTYKYKIVREGPETGYYVQYTSGTTNYWGIGALAVTPRVSSANLDTYLMYGGTTLASVTDGSTWVDTQAEQSNDVTLATTDEKLWVKLDAGATNVAYGVPMYTISSVGKIETRRAFVIFSTNMTAISVQKLLDKGWKVVADSTLTTEKAFYKPIPPAVPVKGQKFTIDIEIPIDSSAASASTAYSIKVWVIDFQLEDNVAIGSTSTTVPTAYGFIGEYGLDAMVHARAYSTSSGAGTGEVLFGDITTPS